jgi:vesicular inhibitory amino acid transporter
MPFNSASDAFELHPDIRRFVWTLDPKALIKCQAAGSLPVVDVAGFESDLSAGGAVAPARGMGASGDEYDLMEMDAGDATSGGPGYCEYPRRRPLLSYEDIGEAAFGPRGRDFITFVLYTELIGTGALFFILEGDHLAILFDHAHDETWYMAAAAAVMIPTLVR